ALCILGSGRLRQQPVGRAHISVAGPGARLPGARRIPDEHAAHLRRTAADEFLVAASGHRSALWGDAVRAAVAAVAHVVHCNEACASTEDHRQFSQELQIVSPQGRSFEWLLGVYYFDETNHVRNEYECPFVQDMFGLPIPCCQLRPNGGATTEASAVFREANYGYTDNVNLVVGGRYTPERRGGHTDVEVVNCLTPFMDRQSPFEPETFTSFTPKVG